MSDEKIERMGMDDLILRELMPRPFYDHPTDSIFCISPKGNRGAFYGEGGRMIKTMDLTERNIPVKSIRLSKRVTHVDKNKSRGAVAVDCSVASDTETSNSSCVCSIQYFDENTLGILTINQSLHVYKFETNTVEEWDVPWRNTWTEGELSGSLTCLPNQTKVVISSFEVHGDFSRDADLVFILFSMKATDSGRNRLTELQRFTFTGFHGDLMPRACSFSSDTVIIVNQNHDSWTFWDTTKGHMVERRDLTTNDEEWDGYLDDNRHIIIFTGSHLIGFLGWVEVTDDEVSPTLKPVIKRERVVDPFLNNRDPLFEPCRLVRKPDGQFWDCKPNEIVATVCTIEGLRTVTILQIVSSSDGVLKVLPNQKYVFFESFMDNVYLGQSLVGPGRDGFGRNGYIMGSESGRCFVMDFVTKDRDNLLAFVKGVHQHRFIKHIPVEIWKRISRFLFLSYFFMPYTSEL